MVIRPIPVTFIAKLCLKPYEEEIHNLLRKEYKVSLFGINLSIKTIAFQEQDRVVSACATSALWSMYHAHIDFPFQCIPSASSITKSAIERSGADMAEGLNPEKIVQQIESNGLKPILVNLEYDIDFVVLKETIKILIDSKLPLILGVDVNNEKGETSKGKHALTVLGYEEKDNKLTALFVHDDRYGPYARIDFIKDGLKICLRKMSVSDNADVELYKPLMLIYAFCPNGLIEQWGNTSKNANSEMIVMFHIKFTNIPFVIININENATNADNYNFGFDITQESFKFKRDSEITKVWFAFGY